MNRTKPATLLLRGAGVVVPEGIAEGVNLFVDKDRIAQIFDAEETPNVRADEVLDLDDLTLFPGFIDVHNHGAVGVDMMAATTADLNQVARFLASNGVTAWLPTFVPAPDEDYARAAAAVEGLIEDQAERATGARVIGLHYEGPFVNPAQCGALRTTHFRSYTGPAALEPLVTLRDKRLAHMTTVAPEVDGGIDLVRELNRRGWIISIGHTRAEVKVLDDAHAGGARHMTHFMNAMWPLHHRAPGPIGWGLVRDDVTCDVIADGLHVDPLMLHLILKCKTPGRVTLISDSVAPTGLGDGAYHIWNETITVAGRRTSNEQGSIAGSVITMRDAARMMLSIGVPAPDVARMASMNPASLLKVADLYGSIEIGKRADLVALDKEGQVKLTIIGGRVAFDARHNNTTTTTNTAAGAA